MDVHRSTWIGLIVAACACLVAGSALAQSFADDFESDLSRWVGKNGGTHHGEIINDPLRPGNRVVHFRQIAGGGDIFGPEPRVPDGESLVLSFEYLGLARAGSTPDDFGGFIGYALDLFPEVDCSQNSDPNSWDNVWVGGTAEAYCNLEVHLIDDEQWHAYHLWITPVFSPIRVILEDNRGVAGDAYFDNVSVTVVGRGDLNCDGAVNFGDINPFVLALSDPAGYQAAFPNCDILDGDINRDGAVNFEDINPFVALLGGGLP